MNEDSTRLLLWVFHATNKEGNGIFHHTYARTEIEARQRESAWMAQRVNEGFSDIEVWHSPTGFTTGASAHWPGSIPAQPEQSEASNE